MAKILPFSTHTHSMQSKQGLSKLVSLRKRMSRDAGRRATKASRRWQDPPRKPWQCQFPCNSWPGRQLGLAASSVVPSSKCLLTWAQRCLSFGMGPVDESSGASAGNAVLGELNKAAGKYYVPAAKHPKKGGTPEALWCLGKQNRGMEPQS